MTLSAWQLQNAVDEKSQANVIISINGVINGDPKFHLNIP